MNDSTAVVILQYGPWVPRALIEGIEADGFSPGQVFLAHNPRHPGEPSEPVPAGVQRVPMERNVGYAAAMNRATNAARAQGFTSAILLTQDVVAPPGGLAGLVARLKGDVKAVGPALRTPDGETFSFGGLSQGRGYVTHAEEATESVDWIDGAVVCVCLTALDHVGGFDERFFLYYEDVLLGLRFRREGWRTVVADVTFTQQSSKDSRPGLFRYCVTRNGLEYARLHSGHLGIVAELSRVASRLLRRPSWKHLGRVTPAELVATFLGVGAFCLRRWGAPPAWLPGSGDYAG